MARPSKLTPEQWKDVERRILTGESARAVSKDYDISEAAIRKRFGAYQDISAQSAQVRTAAQKLADAQTAIAELPVSQQYVAVSLADKLRSISNNLASAAELGAKTAHRLHALANSEVAKVDDADPLQSMEALKGVAALAKLGNESAAIALNLLAANKETVKTLNEEAPRRATIDVSKVSTQAIEELLTARDASA